MISQVQAVGGPAPMTWVDYEKGCLQTYGGGYQTEAEREIFRHGMSTVFNLLRAEFKPADECRRVRGEHRQYIQEIASLTEEELEEVLLLSPSLAERLRKHFEAWESAKRNRS